MPNLQIQPFTGMQNPQQPIGGLLTAGFTPYGQASVNTPAAASNGITTGMGPWSQLAYQMAGSPKQGGAYAQVAVPPTPVNTNATGSSAGGSALGSIATGLLGSVLKNPSLIKGAVNGITGLLGGGAADGSVASILAGGSPTLAPVSTGAVAPAVNSAAADASAALAGTPASGLLASSAAPAASNAIASGTAAASQTGGAAGSIGAGIAAPLAVAGLVGLIGSGAVSDKANDAGNEAMRLWEQASGTTFKPNPAANTNNGSTFGNYSGFQPVGNGKVAPATSPGTYYDSSGKAMSPTQVLTALRAWAKANNVPLGNLGG